jgi:antitoxin ParD1/3/4
LRLQLKDATMDCSDGFTPEEQKRIQAHIRARGMSFEVFLPESLADWLRVKIAAGVFTDPAEAAFVAFQDLQELDRYPEVRKALLDATLRASLEDRRPGISLDEWRAKQDARLREYAGTQPPAPKE